MTTQNKPDPRFIAKQLRKPEGKFAKNIANRMNQNNSFLYDFLLDSMQVKNNDRILEIGFGNGKFFDKLFLRGNNLRISGIDFSEEMVKEAEDNNRSSVSSGKLNLYWGNSNALPFPDNSFDKVFCINVVYFWEQPGQHLEEIYRVLKPGGTFYTGLRSKESSIRLPFTKYGFVLYQLDEWKSVLEKNGFEVPEVKRKLEPQISDTNFDNQPFQTETLCFTGKKG